MSRFETTALKLAERSPHPKYKMAAMVIRGGTIISSAYNLHDWGKHAERRAIRPHLDVNGATLLVVRKDMRMSKPCKHCETLIKNSGISTLMYYDWDRSLVKEKI